MRPNDTWHREFGDDAQRWLKAVRADLLAWGFNSVGWVWVYVAINDQHHRHFRSFTPEEYRWLNMPYGHLLRLSNRTSGRSRPGSRRSTALKSRSGVIPLRAIGEKSRPGARNA